MMRERLRNPLTVHSPTSELPVVLTQDLLFDLSSLESDLLPPGDVAPDFTLPDINDHPVRLAEVCRCQGAVLVFFWYVGCAGCRSAFPQIRRLYEELKASGLEVLAVNRGDAEEAIREYAAEQELPFPILRAEKE